jgi:transposase
VRCAGTARSQEHGCGCAINRKSALTIWFHERVLRNGGRLRKTTIVALARKLLVALWKYVTTGVVIEGATMKAA